MISSVNVNVSSQSVVQGANPKEVVDRNPVEIKEKSVQYHLPNKDKALTDEQLKSQLMETTVAMNNFIAPMHTSLKFELHEKLNEYFVKVVDSDSGDVIREIPSKKMLDMYAAMTKDMAFFVDRKI